MVENLFDSDHKIWIHVINTNQKTQATDFYKPNMLLNRVDKDTKENKAEPTQREAKANFNRVVTIHYLCSMMLLFKGLFYPYGN